MNCDRFIELANNWKDQVCLFGAGVCGSTWGYEIIKEAGFQISFYIDNMKSGEQCNGIPIHSPDYLLKDKDVLCIVTIIGERGKVAIKQLEEMNIKNYFWLHDGDDIRIELPQYLDEKGDILLASRFQSLMNDKVYLSNRFRERMGYSFDLEKPSTFNEKLQWLKIYDRKDIFTIMADKCAVKKYVSSIIGDNHIVRTIGVFDSFDEIDFDKMPEKFVMKCTHDSGSIIICKDKRLLDVDFARLKLETARKKNYFWPDREWPYYAVPRRIIVEEYIESESEVLEVYKVFNFEGNPKIIQVIQDDKTEKETIDYFDTDWRLLELRQNFPNSKRHLPRPERLDDILNMSKQLSKGCHFVRTDFYITNNNVFFSEFTFFTDSGCEPFHPSEWDSKLGEMIKLPM